MNRPPPVLVRDTGPRGDLIFLFRGIQEQEKKSRFFRVLLQLLAEIKSAKQEQDQRNSEA